MAIKFKNKFQIGTKHIPSALVITNIIPSKKRWSQPKEQWALAENISQSTFKHQKNYDWVGSKVTNTDFIWHNLPWSRLCITPLYLQPTGGTSTVKFMPVRKFYHLLASWDPLYGSSETLISSHRCTEVHVSFKEAHIWPMTARGESLSEESFERGCTVHSQIR